MAKLKAKQIVDIQDSIFQQTGSVQSTEADLAITGSLTVKDNIVDFSDATSISGSTFSGSFVGSGAGLTGVPASGIDGQLGIFSQTGSIQATTNDIEVTGSAKVNTENSSSTAIFTNNIQNGYPTSNNWGEGLDGSYFNNFDNTTHVSEILWR